MEEDVKVLRVTITQDYYIPMYGPGPHSDKTHINGWTIEEVINDWFKNHSLCSHHATRDGHLIGYSQKFIKSEILDP